MNIQGNIQSVVPVTGQVTVARCQYDNDSDTITVIFRVTPAQGRPRPLQQTITGADVTALGANWGDNDLVNWLVSKFGLTNLDTPQAAGLANQSPVSAVGSTGGTGITATQI